MRRWYKIRRSLVWLSAGDGIQLSSACTYSGVLSLLIYSIYVHFYFIRYKYIWLSGNVIPHFPVSIRTVKILQPFLLAMFKNVSVEKVIYWTLQLIRRLRRRKRKPNCRRVSLSVHEEAPVPPHVLPVCYTLPVAVKWLFVQTLSNHHHCHVIKIRVESMM